MKAGRLNLSYQENKHIQGRNFGLKLGVSIQEENEAPLGSEARCGKRWGVGEWRVGIYLPPVPIRLGLRSVVSSPVRSCPGRKRFYCNLMLPQLTANSSFFILKSGLRSRVRSKHTTDRRTDTTCHFIMTSYGWRCIKIDPRSGFPISPKM